MERHPDSIIVYHSRAEQAADEFFWENGREVGLWFGGILLVFCALVGLFELRRKRRNRW